MGLKNDLDRIPDLLADTDFAVNEQCAEYEECELLVPFVTAGKAVFHVGYERDAADFCPAARKRGFGSMRKKYALGAWREPCGTDGARR